MGFSEVSKIFRSGRLRWITRRDAVEVLDNFSFHFIRKKNVFSSGKFPFNFHLCAQHQRKAMKVNSRRVLLGRLAYAAESCRGATSHFCLRLFSSLNPIPRFMRLRFADCLFRLLLISHPRKKYSIFFSLIFCMRVSLASSWFGFERKGNRVKRKIFIWIYEMTRVCSTLFVSFRCFFMSRASSCR